MKLSDFINEFVSIVSKMETENSQPLFQVVRFTTSPDLETAIANEVITPETFCFTLITNGEPDLLQRSQSYDINCMFFGSEALGSPNEAYISAVQKAERFLSYVSGVSNIELFRFIKITSMIEPANLPSDKLKGVILILTIENIEY